MASRYRLSAMRGRSLVEVAAARATRASPLRGEDGVCLVEGGDEAVDVLGRGVDVEAGAGGGDEAELTHQRLAAVVAGADGDVFAVEDRRHVVRVDVAEGEG